MMKAFMPGTIVLALIMEQLSRDVIGTVEVKGIQFLHCESTEDSLSRQETISVSAILSITPLYINHLGDITAIT